MEWGMFGIVLKAVLWNSSVRAAFTCLKSGHKLPRDPQEVGFVNHWSNTYPASERPIYPITPIYQHFGHKITDFGMNSITALTDLKYWTHFFFLHDTSGCFQVTSPEQTSLCFSSHTHTISFNSCQQGTEFFRAWPAQTCTGFISIIKDTISIQAQI